MGAPNIQQQLYLKTALNESKDGMFDHPADLDEGTKGSHKNVMYLYKRFRKAFDRDPHSAETQRLTGLASLADMKLDVKELLRGGASEQTIRDRINKGKWSKGWGAKNRFARRGERRRSAALKAKGISEALVQKLDERTKGSHKNVMNLYNTFRKAFDKDPHSDETKRLTGLASLADLKLTAKILRRGGASEKTIRDRINKDKWSKGYGAINRFEREGQRKRMAALKAKGLAEGSLGSAKLHKGGEFNPHKYRKLQIRDAVRHLRSHGRDPNLVKLPLSVGIENYGFHASAAEKRNKALKAKGLLPDPKPLSPEVAASVGRIGRLARQRRGIDY